MIKYRTFDPAKPDLSGVGYPQVWKVYRRKVIEYELKNVHNGEWKCPTCNGEDRLERRNSKRIFTGMNCSHIYPRAVNYFLEWFPFNCIVQCGWCNVVGEGMVLSLIPVLLERKDMNDFANDVGFENIIKLLAAAVNINKEVTREQVTLVHKSKISEIIEFYKSFFKEHFRA